MFSIWYSVGFLVVRWLRDFRGERVNEWGREGLSGWVILDTFSISVRSSLVVFKFVWTLEFFGDECRCRVSGIFIFKDVVGGVDFVGSGMFFGEFLVSLFIDF